MAAVLAVLIQGRITAANSVRLSTTIVASRADFAILIDMILSMDD